MGWGGKLRQVKGAVWKISWKSAAGQNVDNKFAFFGVWNWGLLLEMAKEFSKDTGIAPAPVQFQGSMGKGKSKSSILQSHNLKNKTSELGKRSRRGLAR